MNKLATVIILCYNHEKYLETAVESVMKQSYSPVELIIVDDNSRDRSRDIINRITQQNKNIKKLLLDESLGNCRAFNKGLSLSKGEYIIDHAADDVLLPERIEEGIRCLEKKGDEYGINFTDAEYIDQKGNKIKSHYKRDKDGKLKEKVPEGFIYRDLLARYFICTPTMLIKRSVFDTIGGYDEALAYEDFDFWIRTGKIFKYCYTDRILVKKRVLSDSLSSRQYIRNSDILRSTYQVCLKAEKFNNSEDERKALLTRSQYELRKAVFSGNRLISKSFCDLIIRNSINPIEKIMFRILKVFL